MQSFRPSSTDRVLRTTEDWDQWYAQIKAYYQQIGMWKYADNTIATEEAPAEPSAPLEPTDPDPDGKDDAAGRKFSKELTRYSMRMTAWKEESKQLQKARNYLYQTCDTTARNLAYQYTTLHQQISALKEVFCPIDLIRHDSLRDILIRHDSLRDNLIRHDSLRDILEELKKGHRAKDANLWVSQWLDLQKEMEEAKMPEESHLKEDFVRAIAPINSVYATILWEKLVEAEVMTLSSLTSKYSRFTREFGVVAANKNAFATLGIAEDQPTPKTPFTSSTRSNTPQMATPRPCGDLTGKPEDKQCVSRAACNVINPRKRPENRTSEWQKSFDFYVNKLKKNPKLISVAERFKDTEVLDIVKAVSGNSNTKLTMATISMTTAK